MSDRIFVVNEYSIGGGLKRSGEAVSLNRESGSPEIGDAVIYAINRYKDNLPGSGMTLAFLSKI